MKVSPEALGRVATAAEARTDSDRRGTITAPAAELLPVHEPPAVNASVADDAAPSTVNLVDQADQPAQHSGVADHSPPSADVAPSTVTRAGHAELLVQPSGASHMSSSDDVAPSTVNLVDQAEQPAQHSAVADHSPTSADVAPSTVTRADHDELPVQPDGAAPMLDSDEAAPGPIRLAV
ncbi:MAG TPA: hypothetical protein VGL99_25295, partial [Chloroflexota bacterium]